MTVNNINDYITNMLTELQPPSNKFEIINNYYYSILVDAKDFIGINQKNILTNINHSTEPNITVLTVYSPRGAGAYESNNDYFINNIEYYIIQYKTQIIIDSGHAKSTQAGINTMTDLLIKTVAVFEQLDGITYKDGTGDYSISTQSVKHYIGTEYSNSTSDFIFGIIDIEGVALLWVYTKQILLS